MLNPGRGKAKQNIKIMVFQLFQNIFMIENLPMDNMCKKYLLGGE